MFVRHGYDYGVRRLPEALQRLFVPGVVDYDPDVEGQKIGENGEVLLGTRCGPSRFELSALVHEMSHLVEIDDRRVTLPGWGLRIKSSVVVGGQRYFEPRTTQATARELRVVAYESNMLHSCGIARSLRQLVRALTILPDFILLPGRCERDRLNWCETQVGRLVEQEHFSVPSFEQEWWRKIEVIRRRLQRRRRRARLGMALP